MRVSTLRKFTAATLALSVGAFVLATSPVTAAPALQPASLPEAPAGSLSCYPTGLGPNVSLGDPKVVLGVTGEYDQAACRALFGAVLKLRQQQDGSLPKVKRSTASFVGINGAYFATKDDVYGWNDANTPRKLPGTVNASCAPAGAWDAIQARAVAKSPGYDPSKPSKFVVNQCSNGTYMSELMYGSRGVFTGKQKKKLLRTVPSTVKVKGVEKQVLTWTRGYLLLKYGNKCADCGVPGSADFRAVIDAGSSGTRLLLYKVKYKPNGYPKVTWKKTFEGDDDGIDDYVNPDVSQRPGTGNLNKDVIDPLIEAATTTYLSKRKPQRKSNIKVDLLATAGMREAQAKWGKSAVKKMYSGIRTNLNNASTPFNQQLKGISAGSKFSAGKVQTINGDTQEGVWTWVNLNDYYCNYFKDPNGKKKKGCRGAKGGVLGVLEVGGASTQVAFPVRAKKAKPRSYVHQVTLNHRNLRVYNKTFLGLGMDSARRTMLGQ